ncbi:hypothetical protein ASPBRDRAFT_660588 [Aspergillus brasiliensis CBS 101740]|uniref:BTB domain-containing protein n=1 Tax=Aspergillus brasiliensis (strain CBS 101740 / IMI 381727 / IBT 21946) TaxID=767769 RepID=A0A1L9U8P5_ASPBC|nr:hypothetical protein ASPBRDRAFT_660588 [Aspergillus brasiliensis CBS 101740]
MSKRQSIPEKRKGTYAENDRDNQSKPDVLQTNVIVLGSKYPVIEFKVHAGLLKSKCPALYKSQIEKALGNYVCMNTDASILSAFVGWAYTGEYPEKADHQKREIKCTSNHEQSTECKITNSIVNDIDLYLFCDKYDISELGSLAITHVKRIMAGMGDNWEHMLPAFITAAWHAMSKFKEDNPLVSYFAHFAAYHLESLRSNGSFCKLLSGYPQFAFKILHFAGPAKEKPQ